MRIHAHVLTAATAVAAVAVFAAALTAPAAPADTTLDAETATPGTDLTRAGAYLRERMAATKTPGLAYAVVTPDSIEHTGTWGEDGDGDPVTADTPFLWGSVSKPVTATAVMTLVERGTIDLDEPVRSYLPSFTLAEDDAAAQISVRHLLEQTSGIPEGTGITDRFDRRSDPYGDAVADLVDATPRFSPGQRHEYTSANYLVLGAVVEAVTGQAFDQYLREQVLDPLQMTGAITSPEEADVALPEGHGYAFGQPVRVASHYDQTGPSYGYLGGTVEDLAHFAMAQLNDGRYGSTHVLQPASVELMQTGAVRINDTHSYGLGWREDARNDDLGTRTIWHGGAVNGYQAMIVLLPEIGSGVVVLQNVYGVFQDSELAAAGLGAARILAGGQPKEVSGDPTYPLLLAGLGAVFIALIVATGWPIYRLLRHTAKPPGHRRVLAGMACWTLGGLALAYLAGILAPKAVGATLRLIPLWSLDVGWLLIAIVAASLLLAATRLATGFVRLTLSGPE